MTNSSTHPHAAFDSFPHLVRDLADELGPGFEAVADRIIDAELGDFCWESRVAEMLLGGIDDGFDDEIGLCEQVGILGFFHSRYLVATCVIDRNRHFQWLLRVRFFDAFAPAESAFLALS